MTPQKFLSLLLLKFHAMRWGHYVGKFLGTCRFLGTTMLIFRNFMKNATFFIFMVLSYDTPKKSYTGLKVPGFLTKKCPFFTLDFPRNLGPTFRIDSSMTQRNPTSLSSSNLEMFKRLESFQIKAPFFTFFWLREVFSAKRKKQLALF